MENYDIKSHPLAKEFRTKTLLFFHEMTDIFEGRIANGNISLSSTTDLSTPSSKVSSVVNSFEISCISVSNDDVASYSGNERKKRRTTEREDDASLLKEIFKGQEKNRTLELNELSKVDDVVAQMNDVFAKLY